MRFGPLAVVMLDNGGNLDFAKSDGLVQSADRAFLIGERNSTLSSVASWRAA